MIATHRVEDSNSKTTGFIIDGNYVKYFDVLRNISLINNLTSDINGVIKFESGQLPVLNVTEINKKEYETICRNNPLVRDIQKELNRWMKKWSNLVLYLTGARQIGKTTELLKFAYRNYEQIIYVNLANEESLTAFEELVISNSLIFGMINYCRKAGLEEFNNSPGTILIIDEIQESPKIYNSIRALQGGLKCHVAVTGSYLGKILNSQYFKPAGNMYEIEMLPLSFREFCRAFNLEEELMNINVFGKDGEEKYIALTEKYNLYRQIGGYPAVVSMYIRTKNIDDCFEIIRTIIERFTEESASYFSNSKCAVVFKNVYKAAFISMTKEKKGTSAKEVRDITEFVKEDTKEHVSRGEINRALSWLKYSKILGSCDLYNQGDASDLLNERRFYFMDCGIANYISRLTSIKNDAVSGILTENFAYTELYRLYRTGMVKGDVPCCSVYGKYKLDFMVVDIKDTRYGIEIKTSNSNDPKSLNVYINEGLIDEAYLAGFTRGGVREKIKAIPIYAVGCRFPYRQEKNEY